MAKHNRRCPAKGVKEISGTQAVPRKSATRACRTALRVASSLRQEELAQTPVDEETD
jgi:hypothetical protein